MTKASMFDDLPHDPVELSPKYETFCQRYVEHFNGARAAREVGFSTKNAREQASRLLTNANIQMRIAQLCRDITNDARISSGRVIRECARLGFYDPRNLFGDDGNLIPFHELETDAAAGVAGFDRIEKHQYDSDGKLESTTITYKYRLGDKNSALEKLGKYFGLFNDSQMSSLPRQAQSDPLTPEQWEQEFGNPDQTRH